METVTNEIKPAAERPGVARSIAPPVFMLFSRVLLFALFGFAFALILRLTGSSTPFADVIKWWPFQVVLANLVCFLLLRAFTRREGSTFFGLIRYERRLLAKDLKVFLLLVPISGVVGYFGVYGATLLVYGGAPPVNVSQPLPAWALVSAAVLFPASNALVECTTYFGYSYERLAVSRGWPGMLIPVFFLALQHIAIPLCLDVTYLLWRFLSFVPMALVVGIFYYKLRRPFPIVLAHWLADLSTLALILFAPLP